mgnify:CR=1 FL=1
MKRNSFLKLFLASCAINFSPQIMFSKNKKNFTGQEKGFKVKAGEGRIHGHIKLKGVNANILDLKISGSDTDGGMAIFEQTSVSQGRGTPLHVHHFQNEVFYVLEGEYLYKAGEDSFTLTAGDSIFLPMKLPHAWTQKSALGKITVIFEPAGKMEDFFVTLSAMDHEPSKEEMTKIFEK